MRDMTFLFFQANRALDTKIYVWDGESDVFQYFDFLTGSGQNDGDENLTAAQEQLAADIKGMNLHHHG